MSRADVHRFLLSDARISARITEILGRRLTDLEQRLSDSVFKSVPQRIATTLLTLAAETRPRMLAARSPQIALTPSRSPPSPAPHARPPPRSCATSPTST
ncbi:hypothetical protein [Streptomyces sp. ISL-10]|uniref:hypothetical protein n=1 Tax=Streptomyces sp. ISL-10 TaxID=2819172 RepID=UPI00203589AA|nr:hypothetical protein [Streptomyces sp. ISL-10]